MIAFAKPPCRKRSAPAWHKQFLEMLPQLREQACHAFRAAKHEVQEELIAEVVANAYVAFARLVERGKAELAFPTPLAQFAIRQIRSGRRVGSRFTVRDVSSHHTQVARGITMERLDRLDRKQDEWREVLVEDKKAGPADTAAARIDFADWLKSLAIRKRKIAKTLARGERTNAVAQMFRISPGRVSQLREELRQSWRQFQGELSAV